MDVDRELSRAFAGLRAGNLPEAERCFRRVVKERPREARAWHMLGLIAHRKGDYPAALRGLREAAKASPQDAELHAHLTETLRSLGESEAAVAAGREAVRLDPAAASAHNNLGLALQDLGRLDEAEASLRAAVASDPRYARGRYNLGNLLRRRGRLDEAEASLREALRLQPRYPQALNALGVALGERGQIEEASKCLRRALELSPGYVKPLLNLATLLAGVDRLKDAHSCLDRALRLKKDYFEAWLAKAALFHRQERWDESMDALRRASRLQPTDARPHFRMGNISFERFRFDDAAESFRRALELDPANAEARASLAQCRVELCRWDGRDEEIESLRTLVTRRIEEGGPSPVTPHAAVFLPFTPAEHLAIARAAARDVASRVSAERRATLRHAADHPERLRIGYLSSDFRDNALGHLTRRLYGLHDRSGFEIFGYSMGPDDGSDYRRGIAADCDHFVDLRRTADEDAARRIHADGIHVLVDLIGFAGGARPGIVARRPAPVQAVYLYPGTMGGVFHDYLLGDRVISPPSEQDAFGERLVVLPHCYQVNDHLQPFSDRASVRAEEGLPEAGFVFCCFNIHAKIEPGIFDVWMRILRRVPRSVLWLMQTSKEGRANLTKEAESRGIPSDRLCFAPYRGKPEHLSRHRLADLFLDTRICSAHTTASDALWSGVPVLTCPGETLVSRVAASLLTSLGLSELVVADVASYEEMAVRLAHRPEELAMLKAKLAARRETHPLFDTPRSVRHLERAYRAMWDRYAAREEPETIVIGED